MCVGGGGGGGGEEGVTNQGLVWMLHHDQCFNRRKVVIMMGQCVG